MVFVSIKIIEEDNFSEENKLGRGGFGEVYRVEKHYDMKCIIQFLGVELNNHFSTLLSYIHVCGHAYRVGYLMVKR